MNGDGKPSNILFHSKMEARVAHFAVNRLLVEQRFSPASSASILMVIPPQVNVTIVFLSPCHRRASVLAHLKHICNVYLS